MQKFKRELLLFLTIASMIGTLVSGFFAFAHWNELALQDAMARELVKIGGMAEDGRFLQPMLTIRKQTYLPFTVVIAQGLRLKSSSDTADVVTLQEQKITLLPFPQTTKVFAYSLDYMKSFPNSSSQYPFPPETGEISDELRPVLNNIVGLQAKHEIASQLAVWRKYKNVTLEDIGAALGRDLSEYRPRVNEILASGPPPEQPLDRFWLWVALLVFSCTLTVVFGTFLWKGSKRDAPPNQPKKRSIGEGQDWSVDTVPHTVKVERLIEHLTDWKLIATGGMAKIWTALDERSGKKVVVKFPRVHATRVSQENIKYRFEAEITHHRKMNHPNIVQFLEAGKCIHPHSGHQTAYLIQEFVNGRTIYQFLLKNGFSQVDKYMISNIVDQIVEVLKYIHQKKVIHRDITWKNIMLDHTGQVHLIDFGNATEFYSDMTSELGHPAVGTPLFHAPLDLIGNVPARDFYSLAMLIYVMSAGKPILGLSEREIERDMTHLYQNLNGVPKSVRKALEWRLEGDFKDERSTIIRIKHFPTVRDLMKEAIEKGKIQTNIRIKAKHNRHHDDEDEGNPTDLVE